MRPSAWDFSLLFGTSPLSALCPLTATDTFVLARCISQPCPYSSGTITRKWVTDHSWLLACSWKSKLVKFSHMPSLRSLGCCTGSWLFKSPYLSPPWVRPSVFARSNSVPGPPWKHWWFCHAYSFPPSVAVWPSLQPFWVPWCLC